MQFASICLFLNIFTTKKRRCGIRIYMACFMYVHACPFESMYMQPAGTRKMEKYKRGEHEWRHMHATKLTPLNVTSHPAHMYEPYMQPREGRTWNKQQQRGRYDRVQNVFSYFHFAFYTSPNDFWSKPADRRDNNNQKKSSNPYRMNEIKWF